MLFRSAESDAEADEIEKWKRSNDAARLRADLDAAGRHSPEIEGLELETGGRKGKPVFGTQAESGETGEAAMLPATQVEMLDAQRDSDKEEMEADAAWPAKLAKPLKVKREKEDERDPRRQQRKENKRPAFGLDLVDERRPSPDRTPLPPPRAASAAAQFGLGSKAISTVASSQQNRAGISTAFGEETDRKSVV